MAAIACLSMFLLGGATPRGAAAVDLPGGARLEQVDFERHVAPLLTKLGCNAAACHGSSRGKGGLKLSLFGGSSEDDHRAFTHGTKRRRVDPEDPAGSLLLLKASGQVGHGGGMRFEPDSWEYEVFRRWIAAGAKRLPGRGAVLRLTARPGELVAPLSGTPHRIRVTATFLDGSREEVTAFCACRVRDEAVVAVSAGGLVRGVEPGSTAVTFSYGSYHIGVDVLVPRPGPAQPAFPRPPRDNVIDQIVFDRLRLLNVLPSDPCSDAEFLRRLTIDTTGGLPGPGEVRAFLADRSGDKRDRKIEELLAHPRHASLWATRLCDMTACDIDVLEEPKAVRSRMWHDWFRTRLARNVPYDQIVRGILCADSRGGLTAGEWLDREARLATAVGDPRAGYAERPGLDLFWRRSINGELFPTGQMAELTGAAFLGVRIGCAQCHQHPTDRWTQTDYRGFANVFAQVKFGTDDDLLGLLVDRLAEARRAGTAFPRLREVYVSNASLRRLSDPRTGGRLPPRALGGPELDFRTDAREQLFRWLVRPENPYFARNFVNRAWKHYFGRGLVEPVDGISASNPASNPSLLDALSAEFVRSRYDIRHVERLILRSRTYQLSSVPNETNRHDRNDFARHSPRRPPAEAVVDMLCDALGAAREFGPDVPVGSRAVEVAPSRVQDPFLGRAFDTFGRPHRKTLCDCERRDDPAPPETLYLMCDEGVLQRIRTGRIAGLLATKLSDAQVVEELFLASLSRLPTAAEAAAAREYVKGKSGRRAGLEGLLWALINTREFLLNH
jgi:Protein of unknown function (DUF1553)/Protein of unknown function (DUF1549)